MKTKVYIIRQYFQALFCMLLISCILPASAQRQAQSQTLQNLTLEKSSPGRLYFKNVPDLTPTNIFTTYKNAFGLGANDKMVNFKAETDKLGFTTYRYLLYYKNIPVEHSDVIVNQKDGRLRTMIGKCVTSLNINTSPSITESAALQIALNKINAQLYLWQIPEQEAYIKQEKNNPQATWYPKGTLVIISEDITTRTGIYHLCYKFSINAMEPFLSNTVYVDAHNGNIIQTSDDILQVWPNATGTAHTRYSSSRSIVTQKIMEGPDSSKYRLYDLTRGLGIVTGNLKRTENFAGGSFFIDDDNDWNNVNSKMDEVATDIHWAAEMSYDYYHEKHGRNSYNDAGQIIRAFVHLGVKENNAYSYPSDDIAFGDGDSVKRFPYAGIDVVGHEFTHSVTRHAVPGFGNTGENGAVGESFCDIFGNAIKCYAKTCNYTYSEDNWMVAGKFTRNMAFPKTGAWAQADTYEGANWINPADLTDDKGGVHINNGVMNKWFYLLCEGGGGINDKQKRYSVQGIGRENAMRIVYKTLTEKVTSNANFHDAWFGSMEATQEIWPEACSPALVACANAWYAVGVGNPYIQIDSTRIEKTTCDSADGKLYIRVKGVSPLPPHYLWSTGDTTQLVEKLEAGSYHVQITDPNLDCKIDTTLEIKENINFNTSMFKGDITTCGANDGWAYIAASNVHGTPEYHWDNGGITEAIQHLSKGWYKVWVKDTATRCKKNDSVEIKEPTPLLTISGGGDRYYCNGQPAPTVTLSASVKNCNGCRYYWSNGDTLSSTHAGGSGTYSVIVTSNGGCYTVASTTVRIIQKNCDNKKEFEIDRVASSDPNDIVGPQGYGMAKYISKTADQPYTIHFENSPDFATAPALRVTVDAPFDTKAEMFSLRLSDFGFCNMIFTPPANSAFYNTRINLRDSLGIDVDVTAGIDVANHKAFWILQSIDPNTGVEPTDPTKGFLPVNDSITHKGEGFVSFTQRAKNTAITGDTLHARGSIVFDINSAIVTNTWVNVVDAVAPTSHVATLPSTSDSASILISITGSDDPGGSGLKSFALYTATGNDPYSKYGDFNPGTSILFTGTAGITYKFFSLATDNVGNVEAMKTSAETSIHISTHTSLIKGHLTYLNAPATVLNNVKLKLKNAMGTISDSTVTDITGYYELKPPQAGKYTIIAQTSKAWGGVNAVDAMLILRHFTGLDYLTGLKKQAADCNAINSINSVDAMLAAKRFVALISSFAAGDWTFQNDTITVADTNITYNIKGLCMGDVNGNYLPPNTKQESPVNLFNEGELSVNPGQEIILPVKIKQVNNLGSISLVMNYPEEMIEITGIEAGTNHEGNLFYTANNGVIRLAWYDLKPMQMRDGNVIFHLVAKAKKLNGTMWVPFSLGENNELSGTDARTISPANLYIPKLKIDVPVTCQLTSNYPNPFSTTTEIEFKLPEPGKVRLTVQNSLGEEVAIVLNEGKETGTHRVKFDGSQLAEGVYYGKLEVEGESQSYIQAIKMVVIRR